MDTHYLVDVGEYQVHALLEGMLNIDGDRTVGDDCAVYPLAGDDVLLVNVDRLASNVEEYNRARLCVAQTLSDIICMGGTPESFLVALTLPRDTTIRSMRDLTKGLISELSSYGARLIGGDTKEGNAFHMVGIGMGRAKAGQLVRRVGAEAGMVVGVTSTAARPWGARWANAVIPELDLAVPAEIAALCRTEDEVLRLPYAESRAMIATNVIRAGLDLSDGIGGGLRLLSRANGVGFDVHLSALAELVDPRLRPVADALGLSVPFLALSPGYNWENMYVLPEQDAPAVVQAAAAAGGRFSVIGRVTAEASIKVNGVDIDAGRFPVDEKFAKHYTWEQRFAAWRENCRTISRSVGQPR